MPILLGAKKYTIKRYQSAVNDDGVIVSTEVDSFDVYASVQPARPRDLQQFPEGDRVVARNAWWMALRDPNIELKFSGFDPEDDAYYEPDVLEGFRDKQLAVRAESDWNQLGSHGIQYRAYLLTESSSEIERFADE